MNQTRWRKSKRSNPPGGECIEIADTLDKIRDSKNTHGPTLHANIPALLTAVKHDTIH